MLGLLVSLWLGAAPPVASPNPPTPDASTPALPEGQGPSTEGPTPLESAAPPQPEVPEKRRLSKGRRLLIGAGVAYGLGSAIQWATAGGTGMLGDARPGGTSAVTVGMTLGGIAMFQGLVIGGIGGRDLARDSQGRDHRAKPLLAGGAIVASLGGGAVLGSAIFWPSIRARCPIGAGCGLAGVHLGGAALSVGVGMMSYGHTLLLRDPEHRELSKKAKNTLLAGGVMLGTGYVLSAALGLSLWQDDPSDPLARRTRNRLLVPVVGPWIHAAGPDAPLFMALVTGGLGAVQIGGTIALAVGAGIATSERRRGRRRERVQITVVPSFDGVTIAGRF
jgi:hypothetical protein